MDGQKDLVCSVSRETRLNLQFQSSLLFELWGCKNNHRIEKEMGYGDVFGGRKQ